MACQKLLSDAIFAACEAKGSIGQRPQHIGTTDLRALQCKQSRAGAGPMLVPTKCPPGRQPLLLRILLAPRQRQRSGGGSDRGAGKRPHARKSMQACKLKHRNMPHWHQACRAQRTAHAQRQKYVPVATKTVAPTLADTEEAATTVIAVSHATCTHVHETTVCEHAYYRHNGKRGRIVQ